MTWLGIVLFIAAHIPDLLSVVKTIISLVHDLPQSQKAIKNDIAHAIQSGDHQAVIDTVNKWHAQCQQGTIGCPIDLAKE